MPLQFDSNVAMIYGVESAFGTAPSAAGTAQRVRYTAGSAFNLSKDGFASNEIRSDLQIADFRHGGRRVEGSINGELSTLSWDDFLAATMRNTWAAGVTANQAGLTSVAASGNVLTFGGGSLITSGFKVGDIVRFTNLPAPATAWNSKNLRITALTATTMTVAAVPTGAGNFTAQTTFTLSVPGRKLLMGTTTPSYTFELRYPDISVSELFTGCRIGGANISIPPNGNAQVQFSVLGRDQQLLTSSSSPYFSSPTAAPTTGILTGIEGGIRLAGVEQTIITSLQLQISLNLRADPVIGTPLVPEIFYGRSVVTGSVTFFLQDETLLNVYANETEADLVAVALAAGSEPRDFISFSMQRIKLTGAQKSFDADGGVVVTSPFQALLQSGSTVKDTSTLVIQRSN